MKNLSIDNLRTFVTIIDVDGFAKAGELLGKSQPAVSLQIKKLESQLDCQLFKKHGQRQAPTDVGLQLYSLANKLLQQNDRIVEHFTKTPLQGKLHLGIPSEFATTLLPNIIGAFKQAYPKVSLEISSALSAQLIKMHAQQPFDLLLHIALDRQPFSDNLALTDDLVWVGNHEYPPQQSSTRLNNIPLVLAPEGCRYRESALQTLNKSGIKWHISYTNSDLTGISTAIQQGFGITALARSSVPDELDVLENSGLPQLGKIAINLVCHQNTDAAQRLGNFIYERLALKTGH
ncbi:MAG: LysR substrate-binding domain-containing protein [Aestuariibacter sp.]